ncbi:MAG: hypothetical protein Q9227_004343 [Pyrenula ochraceoflavens]
MFTTDCCRVGSSFAEPDQPQKTRKTLAERAGEVNTIPAAPPSSRTVNSAVKAVTQAGPARNASSSSASSRSTTATSRHTSNTSFSSSVGSSLRPPSVQGLSRPPSYRPTSRVNLKQTSRRPATALGNNDGDGGLPKNGNGTNKISSNHNSRNMHPPKTRALQRRLGAANCSRTGKSEIMRSEGLGSLESRMKGLTLEPDLPAEHMAKDVKNLKGNCTSPSKIPRLMTPGPSPYVPLSPCPNKLPQSRKKTPIKSFLTKESLARQEWTPPEFMQTFERTFSDISMKLNSNMVESSGLKEAIVVHKATIDELEKRRSELIEENRDLKTELDTAKYRLSTAEKALQDSTREHENAMDDISRRHKVAVEDSKLQARKEQESIRCEEQEKLREIRRRLEDEIDSERSRRIQALNQISTQGEIEKQKSLRELEDKNKELDVLRERAEDLQASITRELAVNADLRTELASSSSTNNTMEISNHALKAKIEFLESDSKSQSEAYATMERQMREAIERAQELQNKLREEETVRRKLHNQVQELKGNIRVFCRVRPLLSSDAENSQARLSFPDARGDAKDIEVRGPEEKSSLGNDMTRTNNFSFDRVFGHDAQNQEVFDEISQLVQSALDGYNVCIFCYGQTGSGKTYTMSSTDGMIPRAVTMIYEQAKALEERGWIYQMEGSFVEVYNENLNDLLGNPDDLDKKKHEIRHDLALSRTTITDVSTVTLDSQDTVHQMLDRAMANRSVAATKSNERSSRSHSVFMLRLSGKNSVTGESCDATLNLVDLAGSERVKESKAEGARLKETQSINRSLSCLGDVVMALGQGKGGKNGGGEGHVPYRNSKVGLN